MFCLQRRLANTVSTASGRKEGTLERISCTGKSACQSACPCQNARCHTILVLVKAPATTRQVVLGNGTPTSQLENERRRDEERNLGSLIFD